MNWVGSVDNLNQINVKKIQLENLKIQLDVLIEENKDNTVQMTTIDPLSSDYRRLEIKQRAIAQKMDEVAKQLDDLSQEIRLDGLDKGIKKTLETMNILLTSVAVDILKDAYQKSVPDGYRGKIPEKTNELLLNLAEFTGEKNGYKPIWYFINILKQYPSLDTGIKQSLETLLREQGQLSFTQNLYQAEIKVENYLMVKVLKIPGNNTYSLEAKLVIDSNPFNTDIKDAPLPIPIDLPPLDHPKYKPNYSQEELPEIIGKLIDKCGGKVPRSELTLQLFLPIELMNLSIEHQQYQIGITRREFIGQRCSGVIVRSYDRHFPPNNNFYEGAIGDWKKYWKRYLDYRSYHCQETLHLPLDQDNFKWWSKQMGVGCKFVEYDEQQKLLDLWEELLVDGIPIALWVRQPVESSEEDHPIMQTVIKDCCLEELPVRLGNHRRQRLPLVSNVEEAERVRAAPLCLLWDNPFRPFNTIAYEEPE